MGVSRLVFLALLVSAFAFAAAPVSADTCYAATSPCNATLNKNVYKLDPQVNNNGYITNTADLQWRLTCPLPTKTCACNSSAWIVGPWGLNFTSKSFQTNYPSTATGWGGVARPYILGIVSRAACCDSCSQVGNRLILDTNQTVTQYPNGSAVYVNGKIKASTYFPNGTRVLNCAYWQHYVPASTVVGSACSTLSAADACGYCIISPPGYAPACDSTQQNCGTYPAFGTYRSGNYSTVGVGCAGGCHDPHFVGAHGTHFDFNGAPEESFCLISDARYQVNMKMRGYYDTRTVGASILRNGMAVRTWMKDLAVVWFDETDAKHSFRIWARDGKSQTRDAGFLGGMELDGNLLPRLEVGDSLSPNGLLTVEFLGYEKQGGGFFDVDVYRLVVPDVAEVEIKLRIAHPLLQTQEDAMTHINVRFVAVEHTSSIHGVLGQTFREGREKRALEYTMLSRLMGRDVAADSDMGVGFLDGTASDYKTSDVLSTDCKFSAFGGRSLPL